MLGDVADILRLRGSEGWLVGGSVRDRLLGRFAPDIDVVVADDAGAVAKQLAALLRAPWFTLSERYPTHRVLGPRGHVDFTELRGVDIYADLAERDFTVNAMAVPVSAWGGADGSEGEVEPGLPAGEALLDPFGGAAHLDEKRLVAVSEHIFSDDPLRLMRAARFCHMLGLEPDAQLLEMIEQQVPLLTNTAVERVVGELFVTLAQGRTVEAVRLWDEWGLLTAVLSGSTEPGRMDRTSSEGGLYDPALLERLDEILERPDDWFSSDAAGLLKERLQQPVDGSVGMPVALRLAGIVHGLGVDAVRSLGRRLKLSGALVSLLVAMASCSDLRRVHPGPDHEYVSEALLPGGATISRQAVLYLWEAAPWAPEIVMLAAAEAKTSTEGEAVGRLMELAAERARVVAALPVDGEVLMRELGLEGGPVLGRVLREVRLAWEAREVTSRTEVLEAARQAARSD